MKSSLGLREIFFDDMKHIEVNFRLNVCYNIKLDLLVCYLTQRYFSLIFFGLQKYQMGNRTPGRCFDSCQIFLAIRLG